MTGASRWSRALHLMVAVGIAVAWVVLGSVGGPYFGKIDQVASNNAASFLPASAESTQALDWQKKFAAHPDAVPAIIVISQQQGSFDSKSWNAIEKTAVDLVRVPGVVASSPMLRSKDGAAAQVVADLEQGSGAAAVVAEIQQRLDRGLPEGISGQVTGPAGFSADLAGAFSGIDGLLLLVAIAAVLVILVAVYRSVLLPLIVLATSMLALCGAVLVNWWLAKAGVLVLTGMSQGILFILVIGACTDYALLLVHEYRRQLRICTQPAAAMYAALRECVAPITASAITVVAGLLCLLLSDLNSNRSLGPVCALGIVVAYAAALSFLPAALVLLGRSAFWPAVPRPLIADETVEDRPSGVWASICGLIRRRYRLVWAVAIVALAASSLGLTGLQAHGVSQHELVLGATSSAAGQNALAQHFPGGTGNPAVIITSRDSAAAVLQQVDATHGVASAYIFTTAPSGAPIPGASERVVKGRVLINATLSDAADSTAAATTVRVLRDQVQHLDATAMIGGTTATTLDTNAAATHDRNVIIPTILIVILLVLIVLLRSILAPMVLMLTTVLSFGASLGVSSLIFNHVLHLPGADPAVPLYGFVFLVALGIDYNIFLMSRIRAEALQHGTRPGILQGLWLTGGVITSAGAVLAATFAALAVIPILFLVQLAVIVALGVLVDALIVRTLLVPALCYDLDRRVWWPNSRIDRVARTR